MNSMAEKLGMVREAESKAEQLLDYYHGMAEEAISRARAEAEAYKREVEEKAREEGELEMREMVEQARTEAEELRAEYMYDRMKLLSIVVERRKKAITFLVGKLERGG